MAKKVAPNSEKRLFRKDTLESLTFLSEGEILSGGLRVVKVETVYTGNEHTDYRLIFQKGDKFYSFPFYQRFGNHTIGQMYHRHKDECGEQSFRCTRVYPFKKRVTQTISDFSENPSF